MEIIKKYKVLLIASVVGLLLSFAVASDSPDLNAFEAFISIEIIIFIIYFIVVSKKRRNMQAAEAQAEAQKAAQEFAAQEKARWDALTPDEQMVELKQKELAQNAVMHQESIQMQQSSINMQAAQFASIKKCPKCGSTSISGNKKGFTFFTGILFSKKVYCTCMNCGYRWKAGKK